LVKAVLATPVYVSVAWILMVSYQLFTQIAVATVVTYIDLLWPSIGSWLISRVDMLIFIYAFSWAFLLSSVIPSVILGKERSILIQYSVILALTFIAFVVRDALTIVCECNTIDQIFSVAAIFRDPLLAAGYLSRSLHPNVSDRHTFQKKAQGEQFRDDWRYYCECWHGYSRRIKGILKWQSLLFLVQ